MIALLSARTALTRRTENLNQATTNLGLAAEKRDRETQCVRNELMANITEVRTMIDSDWLCERAVGTDFKGLTAAQREAILREQEEQRHQETMQRLHSAQETEKEVMVDMALGRVFELQSREAQRRTKAKERQLYEENVRLAVEARERRKRERVDFGTAGVELSWWNNFNTTTR